MTNWNKRAQKLATLFENVSRGSVVISNRPFESGLHGSVPRKKPFISKYNEAQYPKFAKAHINNQLST